MASVATCRKKRQLRWSLVRFFFIAPVPVPDFTELNFETANLYRQPPRPSRITLNAEWSVAWDTSLYLSSESDLAHAKAQEKKKTGDTFVIHNKLRHIIGSLRRIPRTTTLWLSLSRFPFSFPTVSVVFPSIHYYVLERRLYFFFSPFQKRSPLFLHAWYTLLFNENGEIHVCKLRRAPNGKNSCFRATPHESKSSLLWEQANRW